MNIYLRKILKHDITHQISVTKEILNGFFNVYEEKASTRVTGKKSGFTGTVTFLLSTDPRFGGDIKQIINNEGGMDEDDILLFVKAKNGYTLEIITKADSRHSTFIAIMAEERHLIINVDDKEAEVNDIFNHNVYGIHIKNSNNALSEEHPHVCIGWSKMGDLSDINTKEELYAKYDATWPNAKVRKKGQDVGQVWRFFKEMQVGDYVIFADEDVCHIGQITSDYYFDDTIYEDQDADYANTRNVNWLKKDILRSELSEVFHRSLKTAMSIWTLNDYKSAVSDLINNVYKKDEFELFENGEPDEEDNIFEGFNTWLTSYDNHDYTGKQKYTSYANALEKLIDFMYEQKLIDNSDLNDKSVDKYYAWLDAYNASEVAKEYDEKKLSSKTGSAALKKYIKYVEYLAFPHAELFDYSKTKGKSINKIFYGTPGCGKSYHIDYKILGKDKDTKEYCGNYKKENIIRTTFFQDYSNTDFIGQILPKVTKNEKGDSVVEYSFSPGPFTLALIQAIKNPTKKVALVIEEINRGNAPAIFGDIFQLLDRDNDGISEYGIVNVSVLDYLNDYIFEVNGEKKNYIFKEIKLPGNMDIFATMNTSDQNVYTLDTAFVRRWDKEKIKNLFTDCEFADTNIPGMDYTWEEFVTAINNHITKHLEDLQVNEDKQIGAFFVKNDLLVSTPEKFAYKVFDYLWSDVAKLDHEIFFNHFDTFEALIKAYEKEGVDVFKTGIFDKKETSQTAEEYEENE